MKKFLFGIIILFSFIGICNAESYVNLKITTDFSSNVIKADFLSYRITLKDSTDVPLKFNISYENNYSYSFENMVSGTITVEDIAIKNNNGKYGYFINEDYTNEEATIMVYIYNISEDKGLNGGKVISNLVETTTTTTTFITNSSNEDTTKIITTNGKEENNEINETKKQYENIFFKVFGIIIGIVFIIFLFVTMIKIKKSNK